jgi:arylsulfatase A-like enzyme
MRRSMPRLTCSTDDVTVVITSDHGEELQDHGRFNHTQLYREVLRVPLIVLHPDRQEAVRHAGVVQLVDLAPTLYELARLQPKGKPTGTSLARLLGHPSPPRPGKAFAENLGDERALYKGEREDLESLLLFVGRAELYDVAEDPAQKRDLSEDRPRLRSLLKELTAFKPQSVAPATAPPLDPELEKQLRALGYLQ